MKPKTPRSLVEKGEDLNNNGGVMFIGEKGIIYTSYDGYNDMQILGVDNAEEIVASIKVPEESISRSRNEMINTFTGQTLSRGNFENVQTIAEAICLGNLTVRTGWRLHWNSENLKVTNFPEVNKYVTREYRKGWEI